MGVGAVALLYFTVRRTSGASAGLIAGAALALTPVATLMFRYNNPDALLVLLLVTAAYCTVRAIDGTTVRRMSTWMALAGCAVGFAFLTKMLQAFLPLPGLALAFLVAAPFGFWKRLGALLIGGATMIVSAGWYVALVSLWPTDSRPYIAGSTDNSLLQLAFGYNGIERIAGNEGGGPGGGGPGPHMGGGGGGMNLFFGGSPGIGRLFGSAMGVEASWLLPAVARRTRRRGVSHVASTARRRGACRPGAVGRLGPGDRCGVQLHGGNRPSVLQRCARTGCGCTGGDFSHATVRAQGVPGAPLVAGRHARGHRGLVLPPARSNTRVVACGPLGGADRVGGGRPGPRCARTSAGEGHRGRRRGRHHLRTRWLGGHLDLQRRQ